jgi:plastocyanin
MRLQPRLLVTVAFLSACTAGGIPTSSGGGGGGGTGPLVTIDVNLTENAPVSTPYGESGGYKPAVTTVAVGSRIRFMNSDGFAHTATSVPKNATTFPVQEPFGISAQTQSGTTLSGGFSSGVLQPGSFSQTILVDKPGTYLFGCFFHYPAPMRGAIVAK